MRPHNGRYIYNPHTYDELRSMMGDGKIDIYLECVSAYRVQDYLKVDLDEIDSIDQINEECSRMMPKVPILEQQMVSSIAVVERCKSNYQQKQWDVGAFMLYDSSRAPEEITVQVPYMPLDDDAVGRCLLRAEKNRESNGACMMDYISAKFFRQGSPSIYWRYEKVLGSSTVVNYNARKKEPTVDSSSTDSFEKWVKEKIYGQGSVAGAFKGYSVIQTSDNIDACIVFSGPARLSNKSVGEATAAEFRKCSHDYEDTGCMIPHMVWSSSSANKVPVATLHAVEEIQVADREQVQ